MLEKLFESLDEKVFTPEMKEKLEERFQTAVNEKAEELVEEKVQERIDFISEKSEEYSKLCEEEFNAKVADLNRKAEEYVELKEKEMADKVSAYLDRVVESFVKEAKEQLITNVDHAEAKAITEAFSKFVKLAGVEVADIVEAKKDSSSVKKLAEAEETNNQLINENIELREKINLCEKKIDDLLKAGYINQVMSESSMTEVQKAKFEKLAEMVEFERSNDYIEKIESIAESVSDDEVKNESVNESKSEQSDSKVVPEEESRWKSFL